MQGVNGHMYAEEIFRAKITDITAVLHVLL